jgi:hypothetical protein
MKKEISNSKETKRITVALPLSVGIRAKKYALDQGCTLAALVLRMAQTYLDSVGAPR